MEGAELAFVSGLDGLIHEGGGDALAAEVEVDADIVDEQKLSVEVEGGEEEGAEVGVVVDTDGEAFEVAGGDLAGEEELVVGEGVVVGAFFAEGAFVDPPGEGEA